MGCTPSAIERNNSVSATPPVTLNGLSAGDCLVIRHCDEKMRDNELVENCSNNRRESRELLLHSKDGDINSFTGKMKLRTIKMTVLLVFGKEDSQCEAFKKAAERGNYKYFLTKNADAAIESFTENQQDLVIIDCRHSKYFEHEKLCRTMKSAHPKGHSRFLAVMNKSMKDEPSVVPLLNAGFFGRFAENTNIATCYNELISIDRAVLTTQRQQQSLMAMWQALQNISESVEITDTNIRTEFVNSTFEKQTGYSASEVVGKEFQEKLQVDNCNEEQTLAYHMRKDEVWEGQQSVRKKNGDTIQCKCRVVPVESSQGTVVRYIITRTVISPSEIQYLPNISDRFRELEPRSHGLMHIKRKESVTRVHSMTIEAPITKVINMLHDAQASSPNVSVVQALDKVLDILTTTELFAPHIHQVKEEDPLTNDYVEGLCDRSAISNQSRPSFSHKTSFTGNRLNSTLKLQTSAYNSSPEIQKLLEINTSWSFDIIKLESLTNKNVLVPLGMKIFERFGAMEHLGIDERVMANWLQLIGSNYHSKNPYHNATHAADVLQATAYFLDKMRPKKMLDPQDEVAALIAAVIHDVDHPARTSVFLVNRKDKLALLYNDIAVLENHHAALGFLLTSKDDNSNILKNLDRQVYESLRKNVIDMVLATEMAKHFEHFQRFMHMCSANMKATEEESGVKSGAASVSSDLSADPQKESRRQILRMVIKCADVSNPARETHLMKEWAYRIAEEYFQQTDEERQLNLPVVMPHFDRHITSIPRSQIKFMDIFLMDMFAQWDAYLDIPEVANQLQNNYKYWKELDEQEQTTDGDSITTLSSPPVTVQ